MEKALNIYKKLLSVSKSIPDIHKIKQDGVKHKVVLSSLIVEPIKKAIDNAGLFLECEILSFEQYPFQQETFKGSRTMYATTLKMVYTFVNVDNPEEKVKKDWFGCFTMSDPGTSYGATLTYTEKYFLLKFFNVPTDEDDPDLNENQNNYKSNYEKKPLPESKPENKPETKVTKPFPVKEVEKDFISALTFDGLKELYETALKLYPDSKKQVTELKDKAKKIIADRINNEALKEIKA